MLILASNSPRRKKLLEDAGLTFNVVSVDIDETIDEKLRPEMIVMSIAEKKARSVKDLYPNDVIISADTLVVFESEILGKPKDEADAYRMLKMLSGNHHEVYTGVTIIKDDKEVTFYAMSEVWMNAYNDLQIYDYIKTKEPMDKAGAYAIQGLGKDLVEHYSGDFFTIVGLPLKQLLNELKALDAI